MLTKRDLELFQLISKCSILSTRQIATHIFSGIQLSTVLRRLRKLEKEKFLLKIEGLPNFERAWAITTKASEQIGKVHRRRNFNPSITKHEVMLSEIYLKFNNLGILRSWIPESEVRSEKVKIFGLRNLKNMALPDGIMGVETSRGIESVAVELELHYKNSGRYKNIFSSYSNKKDLFAVWYFVESRSFGEYLQELHRKTTFNIGPKFLWSLYSDFIEKGASASFFYEKTEYEIRKSFLAKEQKTTG